VIEEMDSSKTEGYKTTTELRQERFNLRFLLSRVIMLEKYRKGESNISYPIGSEK
jgi:hypothetical protein